jgi:hypothetical protein
LLTIAALRSSSRSTTFFSDNSLNAISTIDTAPWTIFCGGDDGFGLLAPEHHLRDFGRIREMHQPCLVERDAGLAEALLIGRSSCAVLISLMRSILRSLHDASRPMGAIDMEMISQQYRQMSSGRRGRDAKAVDGSLLGAGSVRVPMGDKGLNMT